jgi:alpha-N-arabinofuranosidase
VYDVADAVVVGSLLISLIRHADRVAIGCQAQLVNVIAPILTRPGGAAWRQTIFHPFAQASRWARGETLLVEPQVRCYEAEGYGDVPLVHATATWHAESGDVTVLCVNRSTDQVVQLDTVVAAVPGARLVEATVLAAEDPSARNTEEQPDAVVPRRNHDALLDDGHLRAPLPPVSWNVFRLTTRSP